MKTAKLSDIIGIIGKIAPSALAESWDNPGLQVGDPAAEVSRIMVALDPTAAVVESALARNCQLLVTHHPLIFKALKNISAATLQGRLDNGGCCIQCNHDARDLCRRVAHLEPRVIPRFRQGCRRHFVNHSKYIREFWRFHPAQTKRVQPVGVHSCGIKDMGRPVSSIAVIRRIFLGMKWWAHQDSNLGPTGYEPVALAN